VFFRYRLTGGVLDKRPLNGLLLHRFELGLRDRHHLHLMPPVCCRWHNNGVDNNELIGKTAAERRSIIQRTWKFA